MFHHASIAFVNRRPNQIIFLLRYYLENGALTDRELEAGIAPNIFQRSPLPPSVHIHNVTTGAVISLVGYVLFALSAAQHGKRQGRGLYCLHHISRQAYQRGFFFPALTSTSPHAPWMASYGVI